MKWVKVYFTVALSKGDHVCSYITKTFRNECEKGKHLLSQSSDVPWITNINLIWVTYFDQPPFPVSTPPLVCDYEIVLLGDNFFEQ